MNTRKPLIATLAALALITLFGLVALAQTPTSSISESSVFRFADASEIEGSYSQLIRTDGAVAMELKTTDLEANAPYTAWWVVFNNPTACSDACGEDDIFNAEGLPEPNPEALISILFADGAMSDAEGNVSFSAILPEGRTLGEVVIGEGLQDAENAEVHLVVRAHGALDAARAYDQLTSFEPPPLLGGACEVCEDVQFVVYQPAQIAAGN